MAHAKKHFAALDRAAQDLDRQAPYQANPTRTAASLVAPGSALMPYEQFNPIRALAELSLAKPAWVANQRTQVDGGTIDRLREMNRHWFSQNFGMNETAAMLWLINLRLTALGIAPAWRHGPFHSDLAARAPNPSRPGGKQMLGSARKKAYMRRWIDLEWLRAELGHDHQIEHTPWRHACSANRQFAEAAWDRVNRVQSSGGGSFGVQGAYMVVTRLRVPKLHRVALTGLVDKHTARRRATALRRVKDDIRPRLEQLKRRPHSPLTPAQVEHRVQISEAIELGQGVPSHAAVISRWMTGKSITPQSIQVMRDKIAEQCKLTRMYWGRCRAAPNAHILLLK